MRTGVNVTLLSLALRNGANASVAEESADVNKLAGPTQRFGQQSLNATAIIPVHTVRMHGDGAESEVIIEDSREARSALQVLILITMMAIAFCASRMLHRHRIFCLPESAATILIGFVVGLIVHLVSPAESEAERNFYFDPEVCRPCLVTHSRAIFNNLVNRKPLKCPRGSPAQFFALFLLPPIIFESGFALNQRLFFANFGSILTFAVVGTVISTALMWLLVYKLGQLGYILELSMVEAGAFASLISAVDPVATLATFSSLKADPKLHNLVFGESVLNDAVAIVLLYASALA